MLHPKLSVSFQNNVYIILESSCQQEKGDRYKPAVTKNKSNLYYVTIQPCQSQHDKTNPVKQQYNTRRTLEPKKKSDGVQKCEYRGAMPSFICRTI